MRTMMQKLREDVRLKEGLNACMGCGICTAVCPAAEYFEYDPRSIVVTVQSGNEEKIRKLIESDTIWMCGQCMSCKPRCPRNNCPGLIISVLRRVSQETGAFVKSRLGRQQYLILKTIGTNILETGYCVYPASVVPETHPEQGDVWKWIYDNKEAVYERVGANLDKEGPGAMRKIGRENLDELERVFAESGGQTLFTSIVEYSRAYAKESGFVDANGQPDMEKYTDFLLNEDNDEK
ncbi:heterodisulfide reductase subunit C [Marinilabilia salmonicolor]|uniref:4Fe-4S dicluster domain-containing protein n=1 Tax=Marinilabilia salmonicolor TaxID=989 RepID=UPI000D081581|nr:4Fe-4S dicluster domain-containing protein [Marinilabilia salmonicolor]PRY98817.1 heterodisulfide reductase subunit C [Marinilabilia salmonicolor]